MWGAMLYQSGSRILITCGFWRDCSVFYWFLDCCWGVWQWRWKSNIGFGIYGIAAFNAGIASFPLSNEPWW